MIRLVWLFILAAGLAAGAAILSGQQGDVAIRLGSTTYTMPPAVAAALCVLTVALLVWIWRLIGLIFDWPGAMSRARRERRRRARYLSLARGMVAVAAGDAREAKRHAAKAKSKSRGKGEADEPLLAQLLNAQTAQLDGDEAAAARAYADMLGAEETEFLGLRGLFVQATRRGAMRPAPSSFGPRRHGSPPRPSIWRRRPATGRPPSAPSPVRQRPSCWSRPS